MEIGDEVYIFWHRQTHGTGFSRQGCADKVQIAEDGTIPQIEITSCGLNGGPLPAKNTYQSYIACHLTEKDREAVGHVVEPGPGEKVPRLPEEMPYITEEDNADYEKGLKPYIANLREGAVAGFKYFAFDGDEKKITLELRGTGTVQVLLDEPDGEMAASVTVDSDRWEKRAGVLTKVTGVHSVYVKVTEGILEFASIKIE